MTTKSIIAVEVLQGLYISRYRLSWRWGLSRSVTSFEAINFPQAITEIGMAKQFFAAEIRGQAGCTATPCSGCLGAV